MRPSRRLTLLIVLVIAGLAPATYASPPDPTWLAGYWDNADFDNVVILLEGTAAVVPALTVDPGPPVQVVARVEASEPPVVAAAVDETASPRAPPLPVSAS